MCVYTHTHKYCCSLSHLAEGLFCLCRRGDTRNGILYMPLAKSYNHLILTGKRFTILFCRPEAAQRNAAAEVLAYASISGLALIPTVSGNCVSFIYLTITELAGAVLPRQLHKCSRGKHLPHLPLTLNVEGSYQKRSPLPPMFTR